MNEKLENFSEKKEEKQIIEGVIGDSLKDWEKKLPPGVLPQMVDKFLGSDGLWHWHLLPEYIQDEEERKKYEEEREMWP